MKSLKQNIRYSVKIVMISLKSSILFAKLDSSGLNQPTRIISPTDVSIYTPSCPTINSSQNTMQRHMAIRRVKKAAGIKTMIHLCLFRVWFVPSSSAPYLSLKPSLFHFYEFLTKK